MDRRRVELVLDLQHPGSDLFRRSAIRDRHALLGKYRPMIVEGIKQVDSGSGKLVPCGENSLMHPHPIEALSPMRWQQSRMDIEDGDSGSGDKLGGKQPQKARQRDQIYLFLAKQFGEPELKIGHGFCS